MYRSTRLAQPMNSELPPYNTLLGLLLDLSDVPQDLRFHPEGDALYHSLQVFGHARRTTKDPLIRAAALFHDVGKAYSGSEHDQIGADLLDGVLNPRVVYLVRHHLDLLRTPRQTKRRHNHDKDLLGDLMLLRRFDLAGRNPHADVMNPEEALDCLLGDPESHLLSPGHECHIYDELEETWS